MAHPPKAKKIWEEKINKKEKQKATASAIAATASKELVKERGHRFDDKLTFPIVIEDSFEKLDKTSNVKKALKGIGVWSDVEKAASKKKIRAGKGKKRGRTHKRRKSILIVAGNTEKIYLSARNLEGVDIIAIKDLNANVLAPGTLPGRLTLWSESAVKELGNTEKKEAVAKKN